MKKLLAAAIVFYCHNYYCMETVVSGQPSQEGALTDPDYFWQLYEPLFIGFSPKHQEIIHTYVKNKKYQKLPLELGLLTSRKPSTRQATFVATTALADALGLVAERDKEGIYIYFKNSKKSIFKGKRPSSKNLYNLHDFVKYKDNDVAFQTLYKKQTPEEVKNILANAYKIHLMPKQEDFNEIVSMFLSELEKNTKLQEVFYNFKILANPVFIKHFSSQLPEKIAPTIVLYPALGKENAQQVLDIVANLYGKKEGSAIIPRFNKQITSLIYYAQGEGDDKKVLKLRHYYEPDFVHYKKDFIKEGEEQNYSLTDPLEKEKIIESEK